MKAGKAPCPSRITVKLLKISGGTEYRLVINVVNQCCYTILNKCYSNIVINSYKGKGNTLDRSNYKSNELLDQDMKLTEKNHSSTN